MESSVTFKKTHDKNEGHIIDIHDRDVLINDIQDQIRESQKPGCLTVVLNFIKNLNVGFLYGMTFFNIVIYAYFLYSGVIFANNYGITVLFFLFYILLNVMQFLNKYYVGSYNCFKHYTYLILIGIATTILFLINCYVFEFWFWQYYVN